MKTNCLILITIILSASVLFTACSKEEGCTDPVATNYNVEADEDDGSCVYEKENDHTHITLKFEHNFDGAPVSSSSFNEFNYVNANDDTLSITRLRYLISDVRLYKSDGDSIVIDGYQLVDVTAGTNLTYTLPEEVPHGTYTRIGFVFGFDSIDNIDNAYADLNLANWNYPTALGMGGYHFMQMEGMYKELGNDSLYAYHHVTARVSPGVFEQNYFIAQLTGVTLNKLNAEIEVNMDISEWYKNPHQWDLNALHAMLMPNVTAQRMMQANGRNVFSLGTVTQSN